MISSIPCVIDKVKLKTAKRIINNMKRVCRLHGRSSILHCPEVHWFLPNERPSPRVLPHRDTVNMHSHAEWKLGHRALNTQSCILPSAQSQPCPPSLMSLFLFESSPFHFPCSWQPPTYTSFEASWVCVLQFCSCALQRVARLDWWRIWEEVEWNPV